MSEAPASKDEFLDRLEALETPDTVDELERYYHAYLGQWIGGFTAYDYDRLEASFGYLSLMRLGEATVRQAQTAVEEVDVSSE